MCPSKDNKVTLALEPTTMATATTKLNNGRRILQPTSNRVLPTLERKPTSKKVPSPPTSLSLTRKPINTTITTTTRPSSPKSKSPSPRPPAIKRASNNSTNDSGSLNSSSEKVLTPRSAMMVKPSSRPTTLERKKSKSFKEGSLSSLLEGSNSNLLSYCSSLIIESPGSIAAVRKEQMALQQKQRKMKIAHYGRSKSANFERVNINTNNSLIVLHNSSSAEEEESLMISTKPNEMEEKRCSFITPNSDPIYVAYHDEEWGVPVHDDKMLLELLVLSGAQVGSDWTSILKKRHDFRKAFSEFDAETVANLTEKQIISITSQYGFDISRVRGVVDNANRILQIKKEFGSLDKYIWGFVNNKPISTRYKFGHKIPVKTSKSESISKDMIRRGFRFVGPTVVHSFMQAAGLTNDHLTTCHRHLQCTILASPTTIVTSSH